MPGFTQYTSTHPAEWRGLHPRSLGFPHADPVCPAWAAAPGDAPGGSSAAPPIHSSRAPARKLRSDSMGTVAESTSASDLPESRTAAAKDRDCKKAAPPTSSQDFPGPSPQFLWDVIPCRQPALPAALT